jgi:hypothetical protein
MSGDKYLIGYKKLTWNYFQVVRNLIDGFIKSKRKIKKFEIFQEPGVKGKKAQGRRPSCSGRDAFSTTRKTETTGLVYSTTV